MSQSEEIHIDPRIFKVVGYVALGLVLVGIYMGIKAAYFESGQWVYFGLTVAGIALIATRVLFQRKEVIILGALLIVFGMTMSWIKFDWRQSYIETSKTKPFPYEEYITNYPSLEEYLMSKFGFGENWVDFTLHCHDAITYNRSLPEQCKTLQGIQQEYGIDMRDVLRGHFGKMKKTANMIVKGRLKRKSQLENCLADKDCARVPMLPAGVDASSMTQDSREHLETRRTFWEIVDNGAITPKVCKFVDLCLDLVQMGAINPTNPKI